MSKTTSEIECPSCGCMWVDAGGACARCSQTTDLDEDGVDRAAQSVWEHYPQALPAWADIPEMSLQGVSRASFRRIARAVLRAYEGTDHAR